MTRIRIGRCELAAGATAQYSIGHKTTVIGIKHTRLIGGHLVHLLVGRFGIFFGGWGPVQSQLRNDLGLSGAASHQEAEADGR